MKYANIWACLLVLLVITGIGWSFTPSAQNEPPAEEPLNAWLWDFEDEEIVVVYDKPIPLLGRAIKGKLIRVEVSGIVLRWNRKDTFYPFSNIIWIAPADKVKWGVLVDALTNPKNNPVPKELRR
jgi:hypothetical protein